MAHPYLPMSDDGLRDWVVNFSQKISADPQSVGLTTQIATDFAAKVAEYLDALEAARDPESRGGKKVFLKDTIKKELATLSRQIGQQVARTMSVTDAQRYDLGLTVRDDEPTPVPKPSQKPLMQLLGVDGRMVSVRLKDATGERRGRPAGVAGATIVSYVGENEPSHPSLYQFQGNTTRTRVDVEFPVSVPAGAKVWVAAFWFNSKAESGPLSIPLQTYLQIGSEEEVA